VISIMISDRPFGFSSIKTAVGSSDYSYPPCLKSLYRVADRSLKPVNHQGLQAGMDILPNMSLSRLPEEASSHATKTSTINWKILASFNDFIHNWSPSLSNGSCRFEYRRLSLPGNEESTLLHQFDARNEPINVHLLPFFPLPLGFSPASPTHKIQ
jgi:hypothetical protein